MADAYENLAADYDWIFDDDRLANGAAINLPATARLLQRIGRGGAVLDAACGTGVDAAALARRGFTVWAADGSDAMLEVAAARFRRERLEIRSCTACGRIFPRPPASGSTRCCASGTPWSTPPVATRWSGRWSGCDGWPVPEGTW